MNLFVQQMLQFLLDLLLRVLNREREQFLRVLLEERFLSVLKHVLVEPLLRMIRLSEASIWCRGRPWDRRWPTIACFSRSSRWWPGKEEELVSGVSTPRIFVSVAAVFSTMFRRYAEITDNTRVTCTNTMTTQMQKTGNIVAAVGLGLLRNADTRFFGG